MADIRLDAILKQFQRAAPRPTPRPDIEFEQGVKQTPWFQQFQQRFGEQPNLYAPEYDLQKAWNMGVRPTPDQYDNNFPHWPDRAPDGTMLKSPEHPTIWMQYFMDATGGQDPEALGIKDYDTARQFIGKDFVPEPVLNAINSRK